MCEFYVARNWSHAIPTVLGSLGKDASSLLKVPHQGSHSPDVPLYSPGPPEWRLADVVHLCSHCVFFEARLFLAGMDGLLSQAGLLQRDKTHMGALMMCRICMPKGGFIMQFLASLRSGGGHMVPAWGERLRPEARSHYDPSIRPIGTSTGGPCVSVIRGALSTTSALSGHSRRD